MEHVTLQKNAKTETELLPDLALMVSVFAVSVSKTNINLFVTKALCSRNFKNVKLDSRILLPPNFK